MTRSTHSTCVEGETTDCAFELRSIAPLTPASPTAIRSNPKADNFVWLDETFEEATDDYTSSPEMAMLPSPTEVSVSSYRALASYSTTLS